MVSCYNSAPEWIGLKETGGTFSWDDGTSYSWSNWFPGHPDLSNCVVLLDTSSLWYSYDCDGNQQDEALALCMVAYVTPTTNGQGLFTFEDT